MKPFIQHMIRERLSTIVENAYFNAGVKGLHCLNLLEGEDYGCKLYFTETNHDMQYNLPQYYHNGLTYPFKQYNRNISIHMIKNASTVWTVKPDDYSISFLANEYNEHFENGIHNYDLINENVGILTDGVFHLKSGDVMNLKANQLFTVGVPFGVNSAWLVYEGRGINEPSYTMYSNGKLISNAYLYQKPSKNDVMRVFEICGLLK